MLLLAPMVPGRFYMNFAQLLISDMEPDDAIFDSLSMEHWFAVESQNMFFLLLTVPASG